jgi:hypothetical protein
MSSAGNLQIRICSINGSWDGNPGGAFYLLNYISTNLSEYVFGFQAAEETRDEDREAADQPGPGA